MKVPAEAWSVPGVVRAPLNYRVKGDEKRVVYMPTPDAAASMRTPSRGRADLRYLISV